jgi:hypothetical protein
MTAGLRLFAIAIVTMGMAGCGRDVPPTPKEYRSQPAHELCTTEWRASGRLAVSYPQHRFSADLHLRHDANRLRFVLLDDSGITLAEVTVDAANTTIVRAVDAIRPRLHDLAMLLKLAYLPSQERRAWKKGVLIGRTAEATRYYGGVPIELHLIEHAGWPMAVSDHRACGDGFVPFSLRARGPWKAQIAITLREAMGR